MSFPFKQGGMLYARLRWADFLLNFMTPRIFSVLTMLVWTAVAQARAESLSFVVDDDNKNILHFDGDITPTAALAIKDYLNRGIDTVIINSGGGDGAAGLEIGMAFRQHHVTLIVDQYCFSSCANYLFVGADRKILQSGAALGFHGGLTGGAAPKLLASDFPLMSPRELAAVRKMTNALYRKESRFFRRIGFNPALLKISGERTRLAAKSHTIEVWSEGRKREFSVDQQQQVRQLFAQLTAENKNYTYTISSGDESPSKFYFPQLSTLLQYGVSGVVEYHYPANSGELKAIEKKLADAKSAALELVVD